MTEEKKKLFRSTTDRKIAGVCGGVAEYLNVDPTIIRVLWAIFGLAVGIGVVAYLVAWALIPEKP